MASIVLAAPGTDHGPCTANCEHADCALTRYVAEETCQLCNLPIGYGLSITSLEGEYVHYSCRVMGAVR